MVAILNTEYILDILHGGTFIEPDGTVVKSTPKGYLRKSKRVVFEKKSYF